MKLDVNVLRYLSKEDFRVLTAVEMGQKNHELVPMQLIDSISGLKHGGAYRCLKTLLQHKLVHHEGHKYDGYRLTYMGYDFLAIKTLVARGHICGVGRQIGVGKESDIFEVTNDESEVFALKLHRLGRTSFRDVKSKRDYLGGRSSYSWLYLSRLAALKEFAFMKALGDHGFPVPVAIDNNRHAVLMELVDGQPMVQIREIGNPAAVYRRCMDLIYQLATRGLIHCDFNEFNLLISDDEELTLIDFPQMVSVSHPNARELFDRDVECIIRFFNKKIGYLPQLDESLEEASYRPSFDAAVAEAAAAGASGLDVELAASGFSKQNQKDLESFIHSGDHDGDSDDHDIDLAGSRSSEGEEQQQQQHSDTSAADGEAEVCGLSDRLASCGAAETSSRQVNSSSGSAGGHRGAGQSAAHTQQWLARHAVAAAVDSDNAAAAAAVAVSSSSERGDDDSESSEEQEMPAAVQQQQQLWDHGSVAPSRTPTDISFMGREVQQRLVAQRQKAAARAVAAKATRNVSKAKGKKAKKTAAAMADW